MSDALRTAFEPSTPVQFLTGVGPARARLFEKMGIVTLEHLVRHYPRTYLDAREFVTVKELSPLRVLTVLGRVTSAAAHRTRGGRTDFTARIADSSGAVTCHFFGQPWLARAIAPGASVVVSGTLDSLGRMLNPMFEVLESEIEELLHAGRLVPVHALTRGVTGRGMRVAVRRALDRVADRVADPLPAEAARGLEPLATALRHIHFPGDEAERARAHERLAFEELFLLQTVLEMRRRVFAEEGRGLSNAGSGVLAGVVKQALPFVLTKDQEQALLEIVGDLARPRPMHRLLVGDVGSGKTVVALLAALHVIESGHQVAFMAPTEILARQHAATLTRFARPAGIDVVALTGASSPAERRAIRARLSAGEPLLLVGTHALLEAKVEMPRLGLAIVDEQHRFGVRQRATLAQKGAIPDVLVLSATPIPRTLALAMYGDLDMSQMRSKPAGRGRIVTRIAGEEKFPQVIEFMAQELSAGWQAYVVLPVIEEGGRIEARAAEAEHQRLSQHPLLARFQVGLLHGRMKADDKQRTMDGFVAGRIQVLVTTTVIEVGVDVSNATLMVIENAERFGLSQLHQLRGRIGRGAHRSVCVLVPGPATSGDARQRLEELTATDDGFALAEADLALRGPGELWGMRQSGLPRLKLADLRDERLLTRAHEAAKAIVAADPRLLDPVHRPLRDALLRDYREALELALAG
ncbi:MAG TPA: ATP-dependent DNA helicase RecG [Candidatus Eisenbacteria bacterium]|nr:ATP-dependent DNA helicase RecG [Candidatus Eisenbacteria bacterium]